MEDSSIFAPARNYMCSDDGKVKVPSYPMADSDEAFEAIKSSMMAYKWNEKDALLATYPKNGQHYKVTSPKHVL